MDSAGIQNLRNIGGILARNSVMVGSAQTGPHGVACDPLPTQAGHRCPNSTLHYSRVRSNVKHFAKRCEKCCPPSLSPMVRMGGTRPSWRPICARAIPFGGMARRVRRGQPVWVVKVHRCAILNATMAGSEGRTNQSSKAWRPDSRNL